MDVNGGEFPPFFYPVLAAVCVTTGIVLLMCVFRKTAESACYDYARDRKSRFYQAQQAQATLNAASCSLDNSSPLHLRAPQKGHQSASFSVSAPADLLGRPSHYSSRSPSAPEVATLSVTPTVHELRKLSVNLSSPVKSQLRVHRPHTPELATLENPEKRLSLRPKSTSDAEEEEAS
ncbi:Oidioi.mRNA.OKI2018_I69.PAR.g9291.t1.cds [Oikopleura dioica]|uniref:Oidioi.mRNA.OKI2018_I69.PAR.g9291.t1.cds n=1 Tax=Oikopleura dioica TaxID=34765 RepID=A0ABN7RJY4_OIKDI|nr:Oidioi.mRNA.OKI2018_I69.PAR.g9291.t1.cds [Oikopleura dioica]